jgi:hypothetical protein
MIQKLYVSPASSRTPSSSAGQVSANRKQCHDLDACDAKLKNARDTGKEYEEGDHISQFLKREYYAVSS